MTRVEKSFAVERFLSFLWEIRTGKASVCYSRDRYGNE